jgi:GntR family transcriptional regulator
LEILLNRKGPAPVRDQLVTQLELKILGGELAQGQRLPSVRALARRLKVHHNTVSAAYQDLAAAGHVELRRGSGVFVRHSGPASLPEARGLDEMIRFALHTAFRKGFTGPQIRSAVERWLAAAPPDHVVVVDPIREMAELLVHELSRALPLPVNACTPDDVARDPARLSGGLAVVLPYHQEALRRLAPGAAVETLTLEVPEPVRKLLAKAPAGSIVLIVSHSPSLLPFASVFVQSLRGDEVLVEARPLSAPREWRRLVRAADLVLVDMLSLESVSRARPRRVETFSIVTDRALGRIRDALKVVVPGRRADRA